MVVINRYSKEASSSMVDPHCVMGDDYGSFNNMALSDITLVFKTS